MGAWSGQGIWEMDASGALFREPNSGKQKASPGLRWSPGGQETSCG